MLKCPASYESLRQTTERRGMTLQFALVRLSSQRTPNRAITAAS